MTQVEQSPVEQSPLEGPSAQASASGARPQDEQRQLVATEQQLLAEFGAVLGEDRVRHDLADVVHLYDDAPVRTYLPVLVLRQVRQRLRPLTRGAAV